MNPASRRPAATRTSSDTDLLPARMLNEFVYCPRLYYYEHVLGVFVHNADTLRGAAQHKRVDGGRGELPSAEPKADDGGQRAANGERNQTPGDQSQPSADSPSALRPPPSDESARAGETIHSRSVMLGSTRLGVTAKLDLVELRREEGPDLFTSLRVCPVEYKSGAPREGDDGRELWPADKIQLGLQILLLRENGYLCEEGVVFYRQTRQRVRYTLTPEDEQWIEQTVVAARLATSEPIPPPLDHSPKCPRCSLVSVCLPDETHLLQPAPDAEPDLTRQLALPFDASEDTSPGSGASAPGLETSDGTSLDGLADGFLLDVPEPRLPSLKPGEPVRRLIAPDTETRAFYVTTSGAWLSKKGETIVVKDRDQVLAEIRLKDIHHLAVFGPVQISTALVQSLCEKGIPISYFSLGGWFFGMTHGHSLTNVMTRIEQFKTAADPARALWLARLFVYGKIRNQRTLLMRNHVEPPPLVLRALKYAASAALTANSLTTLLGIEGSAALAYFRNFGGMIKAGPDEPGDRRLPDRSMPDGSEKAGAAAGAKPSAASGPPSPAPANGQLAFTFDFSTRNRRPPTDPVNALLSFGYSLLSRECTVAAQAVGFDPYVGFLHQPRFGRTALALDVMEEFRPLLADSVVLSVINNRMLSPGDFVRAGQAVNLSPAGRKTFLLAWEKRLSDVVTHPVFDYKVSYRRAIELQCRLLAKTLTGEIEQYVPFMTR